MFFPTKPGSDEYPDEKLLSNKLGRHVIKRAEIMIREDELMEAGKSISAA